MSVHELIEAKKYCKAKRERERESVFIDRHFLAAWAATGKNILHQSKAQAKPKGYNQLATRIFS